MSNTRKAAFIAAAMVFELATFAHAQSHSGHVYHHRQNAGIHRQDLYNYAPLSSYDSAGAAGDTAAALDE